MPLYSIIEHISYKLKTCRYATFARIILPGLVKLYLVSFQSMQIYFK